MRKILTILVVLVVGISSQAFAKNKMCGLDGPLRPSEQNLPLLDKMTRQALGVRPERLLKADAICIRESSYTGVFLCTKIREVALDEYEGKRVLKLVLTNEGTLDLVRSISFIPDYDEPGWTPFLVETAQGLQSIDISFGLIEEGCETKEYGRSP